MIPVFGFTALGVALAAFVTAGISDPLRLPLLVLLGVNLLYVALTGWPSILGFLVRLFGRAMSVRAEPSGKTRVALVMPIHEEDPRAVFAAVEAMALSVAQQGLRGVDIFVLSDTRRDNVAARERMEFEALVARMPMSPALLYRRREDNQGRKVGNLADFCREWGKRYDYMVVLDADSLMGGQTVGTLIGLMDANPRVGIIQTVPYPVGRETLFARIQQFSTRLYAPALVEGLTFWQGSDGNYWGHNAIIRTAAFMAHCELPTLPGQEPFGGEILCHDVVEAGLMRGAGWDVWVLPQVEESYEGLPANMADFASRERRWCQGNLQHSALLRHPGLRPVGRYHLAYGIITYLSAPFATALAILAGLDGMMGGSFVSVLFNGGGQARFCLLALVLLLIWMGKLLSLGEVMVDASQAARFGGRGRLLASAALEQIASLITYPLVTLFQSRYVIDLLRGQTVPWSAQVRDNRGVGWSEAWDRFGWCAITGLIWTIVLSISDPALRGWLGSTAMALLVVVPGIVASSRASWGRATRRAGLFLTPEENEPPQVLRTFLRMTAGDGTVTSPIEASEQPVAQVAA